MPLAMHPTKRNQNYSALITLMTIYCFFIFVSGICNLSRTGNVLVFYWCQLRVVNAATRCY